MNARAGYTAYKRQLLSLFQDYADSHTLAECVDYFFFLEGHSQEDALLFALPVIERYVDEFDHDIYDHIGCMLLIDGNHTMLHSLVQAEMAPKTPMQSCTTIRF